MPGLAVYKNIFPAKFIKLTATSVGQYAWINSAGEIVDETYTGLDVWCTNEGAKKDYYPALIDWNSVIPLTNGESSSTISAGSEVKPDAEGKVKLATTGNLVVAIALESVPAGKTGYFRLVKPYIKS